MRQTSVDAHAQFQFQFGQMRNAEVVDDSVEAERQFRHLLGMVVSVQSRQSAHAQVTIGRRLHLQHTNGIFRCSMTQTTDILVMRESFSQQSK